MLDKTKKSKYFLRSVHFSLIVLLDILAKFVYQIKQILSTSLDYQIGISNYET